MMYWEGHRGSSSEKRGAESPEGRPQEPDPGNAGEGSVPGGISITPVSLPGG